MKMEPTTGPGGAPLDSGFETGAKAIKAPEPGGALAPIKEDADDGKENDDEKSAEDDPNKLYPGDKIHASWDQRFKSANPGDPGEYDGTVVSVTPFNLTVQFNGENGKWTFRVMNGCFYDVQNFAVMIYLVKRGNRAPAPLETDPKKRSQTDDYKLILNYLYRKRGKSVLSVLQGDIQVDLKKHGFKTFRDFLECVPGVSLTQKGSVVFAEMTRDYLRMGPPAWANIEKGQKAAGSKAVVVVNSAPATSFPANGKTAARALVTTGGGGQRALVAQKVGYHQVAKLGRMGRSPVGYNARKNPERVRMNGQSLYAQLRTCNPSARKEDYFRNGKWDLDSLADDLRLLNLKTSQILRSVAQGQRKTVEDW